MAKKLSLFLLLISIICVKANAETYIRVGLKYATTAITECTLKCDGGFFFRVNGEDVLWTYENNLSLTAGSYNTINIINPAGELLYTYVQQSAPLEAISTEERNILFNGLEYRGEYHFLISGGKITVINTLSLEDYLKGVVASEMPSSWHIEALKAQSVAARSFALTSMGKFSDHGFNVDDTTSSQVYKGVRAETAATNRAVDETAGKVAMYGGKIVQTYFYSSSGGKTENVKDVWGGSIPYLIVVDDIYDKAEGWTASFTPEDIKERLAEKGIYIGEVTDLEVAARSESDRIVDMLIKGTSGEHRLTRQEPRTFFGLRSNLYYIEKTIIGGGEAPKIMTSEGVKDFTFGIMTKDGVQFIPITNLMTKDDVKVIVPKRVTGYKFDGKGYGHGAGMSQYGAKGMAEQGFTYESIIKFYYPGVSVQ